MTRRIGVPAYPVIESADTLQKGVGFSRGGAAGHKYWKRVRYMSGGKLKWRYYYDNPKDRKAWMEQQARKIRKKKEKLHEAVKRLEAKGEHKAKGEFLTDHPELKGIRATLAELSNEYVTEILGWERPPEIKLSDKVKRLYGDLIEDHYKAREGGEPSDLHGQPLHALRMVDIAYRRLPPTILKHFGGGIQTIVLAESDEEKTLKGWAEASAFARPLGGGKTYIACGLDRMAMHKDGPTTSDPANAYHHMNGGLFGAEVMIHEMAHGFHNMMGAHGDSAMPKDYDGPLWKDWEKFVDEHLKGRGKETRITPYANKNEYEAFAESFTAALMYPHDLAVKCPKTYEWFRGFFGEETLRPLQTDDKRITALKERLHGVKDPAEAAEVRHLIEMNEGILDMPPDDDRLQWWNEKKKSRVQMLIEATDPPNYTDGFHQVDPPNDRATGQQGDRPHDRFYELSAGGRTIYMRVGPAELGQKFTGWDPDSKETSSHKRLIRPDEIKEVYDENRKPVDRDLIYWHLIQDTASEDAPLGSVKVKGVKHDVTVEDIFSSPNGLRTTKKEDPVVGAFLEQNKPRLLLRQLTTKLHGQPPAKPKGKNVSAEKMAEYQAKLTLYEAQAKMAPTEITGHTFRQRSGTFNYDQFDLAGSYELSRLKVTDDPKERAELLAAYRKKQPGVKLKQGRDAKGRFTKATVVMTRDPDTGRQIPVMDRLRYLNSNPDGTHTAIHCSKGPDGLFRLEDPMWAALLTPNNEHIESAEHLSKLCRQAAAVKRKTWVSVKTDRRRVQKSGRWTMEKAGDTGHYQHMQVEFDGAGQPKLVGGHWKRKLGTDDPRIDHLLTDDRVLSQFKGDKARAVFEAEQIHLALEEEVRTRTEEGSLPKTGERLLVEMAGEELGRKEGRTVVAHLDRVIPGKKAGEPPPEPGWDRMPDTLSDGRKLENLEREHPEGEPAKKLRKKENQYKKRGLLPDWYVGTKKQRKWLQDHMDPALEEWEKAKKTELQKEYPPVFVLKGEIGGGAGRKTIIRTGEEHLMDTISRPERAMVPDALQSDLLVYVHHTVDPRTGKTVEKELRLLPPKDGSIDAEALAFGIPGVEVRSTSAMGTRILDNIRMSAEGFASLRKVYPALSLTSEVDGLLKDRFQMLEEAAARAEEENHEMTMEQITPQWLIDNWGVGLQRTLPNGADFDLAHHQQKVIQKIVDNNGRALIAHYMGTGKTVTAIAAAKLMMARPDPVDPDRKHPDNPTRTLIVAPLNTVEQWRQAAQDFDDGAMVVGAGGNDIPIDEFVAGINSGRFDPDMVCVGPEYFTIHQEKLKKCGFDGLVVDEVHMGIKNETAERNRVVKAWNDDMKMMLLMTGTPMTTSPTDFVEYVRLLSNGKQWGDMTAKQFTEEYLEPTPIPQELGHLLKTTPKLAVKPSKRGELAAILAQWTDIAMPKDVRGKTLPAVRIEENKHAEMGGHQAMLYNLYMAALAMDPDEAGGLSDDEIAKLDKDSKRMATAAKAVANCPAYKAGDPNKYIQFTDFFPTKTGKYSKQRVDFRTFDTGWLTSKNLRGKAAGKWPSIDEVGMERVAIYNLYLRNVLGASYEELAGKKITKAEMRRMTEAGWDQKGGARLDNPDAGPLGIRNRGTSRSWFEAQAELIDAALRKGDKKRAASLTAERDKKRLDIENATNFQRAYRSALQAGGAPLSVLMDVAADHGLTLTEAKRLVQVNPDPTTHDPEIRVKVGGREIVVGETEHWISDPRGSLHLLYHPDDWDEEKGEPRSRGGWKQVRQGDYVNVKKAGLKAAGLHKMDPPPALKWATGHMVGDKFALEDLDGTEYLIDRKYVSAQARSLMDPGMRKEREKADIVMTEGNAKAEELSAHIQRFHADGGKEGPDGARQMVLFGNGILDSCRSMEAQLRRMGFRDVNESIEGSPLHDPDDPTTKDGVSPNGKYFVTYIGATHTGDRELNVAIFQKVKDKLGRDSKTSLFVHKCLEGRKPQTYLVTDPETGTKSPVEVPWMAYPGDLGTEGQTVAMSQWTPEQRERINAQFGIRPPESYVTVDNGDGTSTQRYFYGTTESAAILRKIALVGDPTKIADAEQAKLARRQIASMKAEYEKIAHVHATDDKPMDDAKQHVFNNCETIVCSDAAQVGMNLGNAVEMVMYDGLGSPMAEAQRITRSARMLPPAVQAKLLGKARMVPKMVPKRDEDGKIVYQNERLQPKMAPQIDEKTGAMARDDRGQPVMVEAVDENGEVIMERTGDPIMVEATDDRGKTIMTEQVDADGQVIRDGKGPFSLLKAKEAELFQTGSRERPTGTITGMRLGAGVKAGDSRPQPTLPFEQALNRIREAALANVEDIESAEAANPRLAAEWQAIANKCAVGANLGGNSARTLFEELKQTRVPGGTGNLIDFPKVGAISYSDPESGTYTQIECANAEQAIRDAIDAMDPQDRQTILDAGFVAAKGDDAGSHDAASIYMAIRAGEILDYLESNREKVGREMREEVGGKVVTDGDITNRLIDTLTPEDRAILKTKKYLVNVRKLGAAGHVGQVSVQRYKVPDPETGKKKTVVERVFTGYEKEHPVKTEASTRAMGRARMISMEQIMDDVQQGLTFRPEGEFQEITANQLSMAARSDMVKAAVRLVFFLNRGGLIDA